MSGATRQPQTGIDTIRKPRTDDRVLQDIWLALWGYPAVIVAHQMKLFDLLGERPRTLPGVCEELNIAQRPASTLISLCASLGLISLDDGKYKLTPMGEDYLLPSSPFYFGWFLDAWAPFMSTWSPESLKQAVLTDHPQGPFGLPAGAFATWHEENAVGFTRAMHSGSIAAAHFWPEKVDLSAYRTMLDVGGGSGAHSIGAVQTWPNLTAVVLDTPIVCGIATEFIRKYGVDGRITTHAADFFNEPFPEADVHFYGLIFHDWPPEKCQFLAQKSFDALPSTGRIIIHEMLFNDDRTGPFPVAAFIVDMLVAMPGQQYSGHELSAMLTEAGFTAIEVKQTSGYWSIVTGRKP
jgi:O-methyltransferase domain/Dimerisation domain